MDILEESMVLARENIHGNVLVGPFGEHYITINVNQTEQ
jgi:hypothetical protein